MARVKVEMRYRSGVVGWMLAQRLGDELPQVVADALTCEGPGGRLTRGNIEVDTMAMGPGLQTAYDLLIEIQACLSAERQRTHEEMAQKIVSAVRIFFYKAEGWNSSQPPKGLVEIQLIPTNEVEL